MKNEYFDFLFQDEETGEEFIVEEQSNDTESAFVLAVITAKRYFDSPRFICALEPSEAELLGLDTY